MAISGNYTVPVTVNGFSCRNCSDVDRAKKNIDPANPAGGPFGVNDPDKVKASDKKRFDADRIDGTLEALKAQSSRDPIDASRDPYALSAAVPPPGQLVSLLA